MKKTITLVITLLLWQYTFSQDFVPSHFYKQFKGTLGKRAVRMELIKALSKDRPEFNIRGSYYFENNKVRITVKNGKIDDIGNLYLEGGIYKKTGGGRTKEFTKMGTFLGDYNPKTHKIEGSWMSFDGSQTLSFSLEEDYSNQAIQADIIFNDLVYDETEARNHYVKFKNHPLATQLNDFTQKKIIGNMEDKIENFLKLYKEQKLMGGMIDAFEMSSIVYIRHNEHGLLGLEHRTRSYTGGPHGDYYNYYYNFDLSTGQKVTLSDILVAGYEPDLSKIAEHILRVNFGIRDDQSLAEFGFTLPNGKFTLSDNFYIKREGMGFFYNIYEIAPYAVGSVEVFIPMAKLKNLIKKDGLLKYYMD